MSLVLDLTIRKPLPQHAACMSIHESCAGVNAFFTVIQALIVMPGCCRQPPFPPPCNARGFWTKACAEDGVRRVDLTINCKSCAGHCVLCRRAAGSGHGYPGII